MKNRRVKAKGKEFYTKLDVSDAELDILLCGGQLAYIKSQIK